jgi:hypothetical protein
MDFYALLFLNNTTRTLLLDHKAPLQKAFCFGHVANTHPRERDVVQTPRKPVNIHN